MDFRLDKYAKIHLKKGKIINIPEDPELVNLSVIRHLDTEETYTYLGVLKSRIQDAALVKESFQSRYKHLVRKIWETRKNTYGRRVICGYTGCTTCPWCRYTPAQ